MTDKATHVVVVDTNVVMAAGGRACVDEECQRKCVEVLSAVMEQGVVVVDEIGLIVEEYLRRLRFGPLSIAFVKHVLDLQWGGERVRRVTITPACECRGFVELPPNCFDRSDRKFLATAVSGEADVLNATDSDWAEHAELMASLGVTVRQVCPRYAVKQGPGSGT